jgi:hypothetical protein
MEEEVVKLFAQKLPPSKNPLFVEETPETPEPRVMLDAVTFEAVELTGTEVEPVVVWLAISYWAMTAECDIAGRQMRHNTTAANKPVDVMRFPRAG